ncbi:MAG TPA: helical backbone metal receptor [bacterium]|nr:helical backbone metal receptor [bacterium]
MNSNKKLAISIIFLLIMGMTVLILNKGSHQPPMENSSVKGIRIVSMGPYATENLFLLGLGDNITALTIHDLPVRRAGKEIIGTLIDPNIEKILSMKPDIVIASKEGNMEGSLNKLSQLGIRTLALDQLHSFDDICRNFITLGRELNSEETAENILIQSKQRLDRIKPGPGKKSKVFFILGFKPLITTGNMTYIDEMISLAGGINIFSDTDKKWFACSVEEVVRRNPDIIFFTGMEKDTEFFGKRLPEIKAVRESMVFEMDDTVIGSPTPATFVDSVETIYGLISGKGKNVFEK